MLRLTKRVKYAERFDVAVIARGHVRALPTVVNLGEGRGDSSRRVPVRRRDPARVTGIAFGIAPCARRCNRQPQPALQYLRGCGATLPTGEDWLHIRRFVANAVKISYDVAWNRHGPNAPILGVEEGHNRATITSLGNLPPAQSSGLAVQRPARLRIEASANCVTPRVLAVAWYAIHVGCLRGLHVVWRDSASTASSSDKRCSGLSPVDAHPLAPHAVLCVAVGVGVTNLAAGVLEEHVVQRWAGDG